MNTKWIAGLGIDGMLVTVGGPAARLQGAFLQQTAGPALVRTAAAIRDAIHAGGWAD